MTLTNGWRRVARMWQSNTAGGVDDELRFHFEQKVAEFVGQGLSRTDAQRRAEEEFGDVHSVAASLREIDDRIMQKNQRAEWWESVWQDARYVVRTLTRAPIFTGTVVVTLALGLGANAAIFSFLDRLYIQTPAGVGNAATLRRLYVDAGTNRGAQTRAYFSLPEVRAVSEAAPAGIDVAGYVTSPVMLGRTTDAPEVRATYVVGDYFGVLDVQPVLGRQFAPDEYRVEGQSMVAIISHELWQRRYSGGANVLGQEIDLGSHRHVIVGVAPPRFRGLDLSVSDVWVPRNTQGSFVTRAPDWYTRKDQISTQVIARVKNDNALAVFAQRATRSLREIRSMGDSLEIFRVASIIEARGGDWGQQELSISTRLAGVALVILLIACANVVNLLLARANSRQREVALRLALGVSRRRLARQFLTESTVLSCVAITLALLVAYAIGTALRALLIPGMVWSDSVMTGRVVAFTVGLSLITGLTAGIIPAWQATRPNLSSSLKSSVRDGGKRSSRTRSILLVAQTALSMVLLAGAGVFVRSLQGVRGIDIGYDADRLVYGSIGYDRDLQNRDSEIQQRLPEAVELVRRIPGVETVALSAYTPMRGMSWSKLFLSNGDSLPPANKMQRIMYQVSPEFFATTGIRVLRGRAFNDADIAGREPVIAINETMANNLWPGEDPLRQCLITGPREMPCRRVVAVVSPAHFNALVEGPSQLYYLPLAQSGNGGMMGGANAIVVRAANGMARVVGAKMQRELAAYFGPWARVEAQTLGDVLAPQLRPWRTGALLFTAAGLLALLVAAVGVYSSTAYTVSQRTQEMGVRVALGASASAIMRLIVRDGVRVVAVGVTVGLLLALSLGQIVKSMLYEISPRDPLVLGIATLTLLAMAVLACSIPAWRASRVDPLDAMRAE